MGVVALAGAERNVRKPLPFGVHSETVPVAALMDDEEVPVTVAAIIQVPRGRMASLERRVGKAVANRMGEHPKVKAIRVVDPPDASGDQKPWAVTVAAEEHVDRVLVVTVEDRNPPLVHFVLLDDRGESLAALKNTHMVTAPSTPGLAAVDAPLSGVARAWGDAAEEVRSLHGC